MAITYRLHCDRSFGNRTFRRKQTSATQPRAEDHDGRDIRYIIIIQGGYTLKKKNIAAAMLAASMPLLSISAAHATPDAESTTPSQTQQQDTQRETQQNTSKQDVEVTQELVEKYSQYVSQEGDQFRLNAPENLKSDNAQEVFEGAGDHQQHQRRHRERPDGGYRQRER